VIRVNDVSRAIEQTGTLGGFTVAFADTVIDRLATPLVTLLAPARCVFPHVANPIL
jgi:hypothetical protein